MKKANLIATSAIGALVALSLAGCTGEDVFDALGSQVDPYAQKVNALNDEGAQQTIQGQAPVQPAQQDVTTTPAEQQPDPAEQQPAEQPQQQEPQPSQEEHEQDEAVTITLGNGGSIFANWTRDGDGRWTAAFGTYNGTILYSYEDTDGNWTFYTMDGREVVHTDTSSAYWGEYGPYGLESNWQDAANGEWY